jgi:probable F420-dependent oxidoreductase
VASRWGMTYPLEGISLAEHKDVLQQAEDLGYTDAWSAEVNANDAFTPLAAFAAWTKNTRLGCAIANIYARTPTQLAQVAFAVAELAPGRFCLGLGTSSPAIVENWNGVPLEKPFARMRGTVAFLRRAFSGEKIAASIGPYNVRGFRLARVPASPPPIYVAALREKMIRLGATLGDGVITNYISPEDARKVSSVAKNAAKEAGKDPEALDIACRIFVIATEDPNTAQMIGRFIVSGYLTTPFYYAFQEWLGRGETLAPMMKAWQAGERQQATGLVPGDVVEDLFVYGPPQACREKIAAYCENGITTPIINIIPTSREPEAQREQSLSWLKDLAPR